MAALWFGHLGYLFNFSLSNLLPTYQPYKALFGDLVAAPR